ncbi:MAG: hypothetical protein AAGL11_09600 [Pseudomonadota bacterium]
MSNQPLKRIKIGLITATVWGNEKENGGTRYSIDIVRNYKKDDQWNETSSFGIDDLPVVAKLSDLALEAVLELQSK